MNNIHKVIEEDFTAAFEAFKSDNFDRVNIFANRIMSNAIFSKDTIIFLPGFFLKDVALIFNMLKASEKATAFSTAKSHGFEFLETLRKSLSSIDPELIWKEFHDFNDTMRRFLMDEFEEKSYSSDTQFTREAFLWLIDYLKTNRELLFDWSNVLLKGILNEMGRIFKVHSGELKDTIVISLLTSLDRYYEYFRRKHRITDRLIDEEKVKDKVWPYIDRIIEVYNGKMNLKEINTILWELVKGWREFFIQYMELTVPRLRYEKGIELPAELKEKLKESITESLEKKI